MRARLALALTWMACLPVSAQAQNFAEFYNQPGVPAGINPSLTGALNPATDYIEVSRNTAVGTPTNGYQGYGYASVASIFAAAQGGAQADSAALAAIAARLDRFADRFREGIALAGSINVLPPNPGDRFAVSLGGAGYDGAGAGSVAVSARIREDIIAYAGVARGPTQTLVKGGVGFSFR